MGAVILGALAFQLTRQPPPQPAAFSNDPLDVPDADGLFPAEKKVQLAAVRNPSPQPTDLDGTLILQWDAGAEKMTVYLGREQCSMQNLREKLDKRLLRGNQRSTRQAGQEPDRWYEGRRPTFALVIGRDDPYEPVANVLRIAKAAGLNGVWVKCADETEGTADGRSLGFEWKWPNLDRSSLRVPIAVDIDAEGQVLLNGIKRVFPRDLEEKLLAVREASAEDLIMVRANGTTSFRFVAPVWRLVVRLGLPMIETNLELGLPR